MSGRDPNVAVCPPLPCLVSDSVYTSHKQRVLTVTSCVFGNRNHLDCVETPKEQPGCCDSWPWPTRKDGQQLASELNARLSAPRSRRRLGTAACLCSQHPPTLQTSAMPDRRPFVLRCLLSSLPARLESVLYSVSFLANKASRWPSAVFKARVSGDPAVPGGGHQPGVVSK